MTEEQHNTIPALHIHVVKHDDIRIEVGAIEVATQRPFIMQRYERDVVLLQALQKLKPLLLRRCEIKETERNPVEVTGVRVGYNKRYFFCKVEGKRDLSRSVMRFKTPRIILRNLTKTPQFVSEYEPLVQRVLTLADAWVHSIYEAEKEKITIEMVLHEEAQFCLEYKGI
jgi:hypothetical protein